MAAGTPDSSKGHEEVTTYECRLRHTIEDIVHRKHARVQERQHALGLKMLQILEEEHALVNVDVSSCIW